VRGPSFEPCSLKAKIYHLSIESKQKKIPSLFDISHFCFYLKVKYLYTISRVPKINKSRSTHNPNYIIIKILNIAPELTDCWNFKNFKEKHKDKVNNFSIEKVFAILYQ